MKKTLKIGRFVIRNQNPEFSKTTPAHSILPLLLRLTTAVEQYTGHAWRVTSYLRDSPSHRLATALDIAPDIAADSWSHYAVSRQSDPVLYKREPLLRALQALASEVDPAPYSYAIFIEPDHLHLQLMQVEDIPRISIVKWGIEKPIYPDSKERMRLPLLFSLNDDK